MHTGQCISVRIEVFSPLPCVDFVLCNEGLAFTIQCWKILFGELICVSIATDISVLDGKQTTQDFSSHWSSAVFTAVADTEIGVPALNNS